MDAMTDGQTYGDGCRIEHHYATGGRFARCFDSTGEHFVDQHVKGYGGCATEAEWFRAEADAHTRLHKEIDDGR